MYNKSSQLHPQYYFNNLGVIHLKMQKYNLAIMYFSKALKFVLTGNEATDLPGSKHVSHWTSQKTSEILYNYGQALMKVNKFVEAFKCFEKCMPLLKHSVRLWYFMGICSLEY